jgi:hypothetical protein
MSGSRMGGARAGSGATAQHGWPQQYQVNCFEPFVDHSDPLHRFRTLSGRLDFGADR